MFVLIILMSYHSMNNSTSQQIAFATKERCEKAVVGVMKQRHVQHAFCVEK